MRMTELITKKRNGGAMTDAEIRQLITEYVAGNIPDYQMSAWLMAVYYKGMTDRETATLTMAMAQSGEMPVWATLVGGWTDQESLWRRPFRQDETGCFAHRSSGYREVS